MRITIHVSHFSSDPSIEHGPTTARAHDDAQNIHAQLLSAGVDATIVDGPASDTPESTFWFVFESDLGWHTLLDERQHARLVILRPNGHVPFSIADVAAVVTYADVSAWAAPPVPGGLVIGGATAPIGETLTEQLVSFLRSINPPVPKSEARGPFPIGETLRDGAVLVERHLQGDDYQRLFLGRERRQGTEALISFDVLSSRVDIRAFHKSVAYECPGVLVLDFVGRVDFTSGIDIGEANTTWALVERAPEGAWLPSILGRFGPEVVLEQESRTLPSHDPRTAVADAMSLGRSAGRILTAAAAKGLVLARVRPEYMWAARRNGVLQVTALSARGDAFFAMSRVDAGTVPVFDRYYYAPEVSGNGDIDDRALVFALSIMVAEWSTGRFPYKYKFHDIGPLTGRHLKLTLPAPLTQLLSRGMSVNREKRPSLDEFLVELERIPI